MKKTLFLLILLLSSIYNAFSQVTFPDLEPLFETEKSSAELSPLEIIQYGLRFSDCGENSELWQPSIQKFMSLYEKVSSPSFVNKSESEKAQSLLSILYETTLSQYKEQQTCLDVMFAEGTYNCVSSAVLYLALAKSCGLKVVGVKTPSHAFCTVMVDGQPVDVETTNPYGYDPGRSQVLESDGGRTKYAVIPKKNYASRRNVSEKTFISLAGANLSSFWMNKDDFARAVPMAATVMTFRNGEDQWEVQDGRETFDTVAMNYSVILDKKELYLESIEWVDKVVARYGANDKVRGELNGCVYNAIADLANKKQFDLADQVYQSHAEQISENFKFQCKKMIFLSRTQSSLDSMNSDQALEYVRSLYGEEIAQEKSVKATLDKWQEFYWIEKINFLNKEGSYLKAAAAADEGLKAMPNNFGISKAKKSALYNHDAVVHNNMAKLANAKQYEKALQVIEEGLKDNPTSTTLLNDRKRLLQILNR